MFQMELFDHRLAVVTDLVSNVIKVHGIEGINILIKTAALGLPVTTRIAGFRTFHLSGGSG